MVISAATYLIDEVDFKSLIPEAPTSLDPRLIRNQIVFVQEGRIKSLIGYEFYQELLTQKSGSGFSANNQYLFDNYLAFIIALMVQKRVINSTSFQLEQSGLRTKIVTNSELASPEQFNIARGQIQSDIDVFTNEMDRYIRHNPTLYPLYDYRNDERNTSQAAKQRGKFDFGINLSKI